MLNILPFIHNKKSISEYTIKQNDITLNISLYTKSLIIKENIIQIKYIIADSNNEYTYRIEVKDINGSK